jgi:hypothetical protein
MVFYYTPILAALIALAPAVETPKSPAPLQEAHIKENINNEPRGANVPQGGIANIKPNSLPKEGGFVIMRYPSGAWHVAYIEKLDSLGIHIAESNVEPGVIARRVIRLNYPYTIGYGWYQ